MKESKVPSRIQTHRNEGHVILKDILYLYNNDIHTCGFSDGMETLRNCY